MTRYGRPGGVRLGRRLPPPHRPQHLGVEGGSPPPPGTTGLYHVAIRYPNRACARPTRSGGCIEAGIPLDGASDHGVSEALYLRDPDDNGIELYRDRPQEEWPRGPNGELTMVTRPLDLQGLLDEADD